MSEPDGIVGLIGFIGFNRPFCTQPSRQHKSDDDEFCDDSMDLDDDNDGIPDSFENAYAVLNPLVNDAYLDPDGDGLTFNWTQTGGPMVALMGASTSTPSFVPPGVTAPDPMGSTLMIDLVGPSVSNLLLSTKTTRLSSR